MWRRQRGVALAGALPSSASTTTPAMSPPGTCGSLIISRGRAPLHVLGSFEP